MGRRRHSTLAARSWSGGTTTCSRATPISWSLRRRSGWGTACGVGAVLGGDAGRGTDIRLRHAAGPACGSSRSAWWTECGWGCRHCRRGVSRTGGRWSPTRPQSGCAGRRARGRTRPSGGRCCGGSSGSTSRRWGWRGCGGRCIRDSPPGTRGWRGRCWGTRLAASARYSTGCAWRSRSGADVSRPPAR